MLNFVSISVKCPICGNSLMDKEVKVDNESSIKLNIAFDDTKGSVNLSSIYGSYNFESDVEIPDGKVVHFFCPHCDNELVKDAECSECSAPLVPLHLLEGGKITFCSRAGCKKHSIEFDELSSALKHVYEQYSYSGEGKFYEGIPHKEIRRKKTKEQTEKEVIGTGTYLRSFCPHCKKTLLENEE